MMWFPPGSRFTLCPGAIVKPSFFSFISVAPVFGSFTVSCIWTSSAVPWAAALLSVTSLSEVLVTLPNTAVMPESAAFAQPSSIFRAPAAAAWEAELLPEADGACSPFCAEQPVSAARPSPSTVTAATARWAGRTRRSEREEVWVVVFMV